MDPNEALANILRGHLVSEHAEALTDWLARDGFAPSDTTIPADPADFIAKHCARHYPHIERSTIRVRADKAGIWTSAPPRGPWICAEIWFDLCLASDTISGLIK
jgi:hypothetical protein